MNESFVDTKRLPILRKQVKPRDTQDEFELVRKIIFLVSGNRKYRLGNMNKLKVLFKKKTLDLTLDG